MAASLDDKNIIKQETVIIELPKKDVIDIIKMLDGLKRKLQGMIK
jgi:hypothetical protein